MDQKFIKAIDGRNIIRIRLCISNELLRDPRGKTYKQMLLLAESKIENLYQKDDKIDFNIDKNKWDIDFLCEVKNELDLNFSKEKLCFFEEVANHVLKEKAIKLDEKDNKLSSIKLENKSNSYSNKSKYVAISLGSSALAATGICISKETLMSLGISSIVSMNITRGILTSLGAMGLLIGGYLLFKEMKK